VELVGYMHYWNFSSDVCNFQLQWFPHSLWNRWFITPQICWISSIAWSV